MISGELIKDEIEKGSIVISDFNENNLNPNSYNLTLSDIIITYDEDILDPRKENKIKNEVISDDGYILLPGKLYLASTREMISSNKYIPCISGRSSLARLGLTVHQTAFFANFGDVFKWTLELSVVQPLKIYPNMKICQVYFDTLLGPANMIYDGKYKYQSNTTSSKFYEEETE